MTNSAFETRRAEWHRYYSEKRIPHQAVQLDLLSRLPVREVLEIGPYMGFITALLDNAGYGVETLDLFPADFTRPAVPHHCLNLLEMTADQLPQRDVILCCETLEHLPWERVGGVLETFAASGARFLITSVPFMGWQMHLQLYLNLHLLKQKVFIKWGSGLTRFTPDADPLGHKWEVGYKGYALRAWENLLTSHGWRIRERTFSSPCRSVFHVLERSE